VNPGAPNAGEDPYHSHTFEELCELPTVFAPGLLEGQVVLVTGAAGGIGSAISVLCGRLGARIVACGRTPETLDGLVERLAAAGIEASAVPMTIRDPEQVADLVDAAYDRFGRLDVVVNNAGGQFSAPALDISPKGWAAVLEPNLYGTWYVMQAAARRWAALDGDADDRGAPATNPVAAPEAQRCIVNIATIVGRGGAGIAHTAASRAGSINLSRYLAVEWAPLRIRVNAVAVGVVASEGLRTYPATARASFGRNPMRRLGDVWDVAEGTVYLASPAAGFITGTTLEITGGEHVWGEYWPLGHPDWFKGDVYP
jgi:citronellol/citronellal dehydrogenase